MPVGGAGHCLWYSREYRWAENVITKKKLLVMNYVASRNQGRMRLASAQVDL